ncbi:uncharacterized protein LOC132203258 isoform X2 [Neocloeon triangulifer]|uniref:uncharacterized protein LOC132203258 isoform X2 n=1 Tax=Neocloeon triangulifer TaxID=2078957 RepID=UPI00286F2210|nr:uncharacterized protein LOC132203258 isoform X2 [Neocloeon triangulifer]
METAEEEAQRELDTYEHACMRAELLGLPRPTFEEFEASKLAIRSANYDEDELEELQRRRQQEEAQDQEAELVEELDSQNEDLKGASGGLDELANILAITQGKLNKFKTVCGSIKNLFKLRGEGQDGQSDGETTEGEENATVSKTPERAAVSVTNSPMAGTRSKAQGISTQLSSQNDALDRMLSKAENAELSLSSQNKQIKSLLR